MPIHRSSRTALIAAGLTAAGLVGCGSRPANTGGPTDPGQAPIRPLPAAGAFYTDGLADYGATAWAVTPLETALARDLALALSPPPALSCLAREYAARFAVDGADPDPGTVAALARHCGYWTTPRGPYSVTAPDDAALTAHLRTLPPSTFEGTVALGVAPHPDGKLTFTLLRDPGELRLAGAVARSTTAAALDGRLVRGDGALELWVDDRDGPRRIEIAVSPVGAFDAAIPAGAERVELARKQGRFRRTVALFDRRARPESYAPPPAERPASEQTAERLIAGINTRRTAAGLDPLTHEARLDPVLDDWLHRVAERNADDSPPGMLDERGWPYTRLRYAIASGRDADQIVELLVEAPTGRRAVLTDEVGRIAVGLRPFAKGRGFDAVFAAVQAFVATPPTEARAALLTQLNAERSGDGTAPLKASAALDSVAQRLAEDALAGRRAWDTVVATAMGTVREQKLVQGAFAAGAFPAPSLEGAPFSQEPNAMSPAVGHIGIGVAGGPLPDGGAPRYLVVYIVAETINAHEI